ncbi:hypothetical protein AAC387_Pa05g1227 [Persea americana]
MASGGWKIVERGNSKRAVRWEDLVSVFMDNLLESMTTERLRSLFSSFGQVMDVFIPASSRRVRGRCFGFARF